MADLTNLSEKEIIELDELYAKYVDASEFSEQLPQWYNEDDFTMLELLWSHYFLGEKRLFQNKKVFAFYLKAFRKCKLELQNLTGLKVC